MKLRLLFIGLIFPFLALSQNTKNEVEKRINAEEMPAPALALLQEMPIENRVKYYFESDGDNESFEAKFKFNKHKYSVEFSTSGELQDIEIAYDLDEIDPQIAGLIEQDLKARFERHKIEKLQKQFSSTLWQQAFSSQNPDGYELIVATKNKENKLSNLEITYDKNGNFVNSRKVLRRSYDFILF